MTQATNGTRSPLASVVLLGSDHTELGAVAVAVMSSAVALGLSRGKYPKGYAHVDPNEDAAFAASGRGGTLLAVVDGHRGVEASEAAIRTLADAAQTVLTAGPEAPQRLEEALDAARLAVRNATVSLDEPRRHSATALTVCLHTGGRLFVATYGDTLAVLIRARKAQAIDRRSDFLAADTRPGRIRLDEFRMRDRDRLVLMTDGAYGLLGKGWQGVVTDTVRAQPEPEAVVRDLIDAAFDGGAGDNIAVVVYRPSVAA